MTEIRAVNKGEIIQHVQIKGDDCCDEIEFDYNDFPSYTELKGQLLDKVKRCQAEEFVEELNALAT